MADNPMKFTRGSDSKSFLIFGELAVVAVGYSSNAIKSTPSITIPFLLNPESITETLQGGWTHKVVPGGSDPISSWIGNGPRTVALSLLITRDISGPAKPSTKQTFNSPLTPEFVVLQQAGLLIGKIASALAQVKSTINPTSPIPNATLPNQDPTFTIEDYLTQLRKLRYPESFKNGLYNTPPSLVRFKFGTTFGDKNILSDVLWTIDSVEISVSKWTTDLRPLEADVKLSLTQFNEHNITKFDIR